MTTTTGYTTTVKQVASTELKRLPVHRHAGIFRPVAGDELERLRNSIQNGYDDLHPIVVWKETGEIVDGRNRRDLAVDLKCTNVPVAFVAFPNENAVTEFIIAQNLARRHLTTKERAELAGALVINGTSVRTAAKTTGVSKSTTQRAANKARARVPSGTAAKRRTAGADGKSYPATKPKPKPRTSRTSSPPKSASSESRRKRLQELESVIEGQLDVDEVIELAAVDPPKAKRPASVLDELPPHIAYIVKQMERWTTTLVRVTDDALDGLPEGRMKELVADAAGSLDRQAVRWLVALAPPEAKATSTTPAKAGKEGARRD
jgi:ParB-like chromosome segregation protein Spo0J